MREIVHERLKNDISFRERKRKDEILAEILINKYDLRITPKALENVLKDYATLDRYWRDLTREHKALRGNDYGDKVRLAQAKQIELGYEVDHHRNVAVLKRLK